MQSRSWCKRDNAAQRFALPALGRGRRSRPARKMIRRGKLLGIAPDSTASGARFVRRRFDYGLILSQLHQFDFDLDTN